MKTPGHGPRNWSQRSALEIGVASPPYTDPQIINPQRTLAKEKGGGSRDLPKSAQYASPINDGPWGIQIRTANQNSRTHRSSSGIKTQPLEQLYLPKGKNLSLQDFPLFWTQVDWCTVCISHSKSMLRDRRAVFWCFTCTSPEIIEEEELQFDPFTFSICLMAILQNYVPIFLVYKITNP